MDNVALNFHGHGKSTRPVTLSEDQLRQIFMQFDANGDKRLCKEELKRAFSQLGAIIPGYRARRCLYIADADGDGKVDLVNELDHLVRYALKLGYSVNQYTNNNIA